MNNCNIRVEEDRDEIEEKITDTKMESSPKDLFIYLTEIDMYTDTKGATTVQPREKITLFWKHILYIRD